MTDDLTEKSDQNALTMEAIDEDWWHAIYRPLPEAMTGELIERTHFVAQCCFQGARGRALDPNGRWRNPDEPQLSAYAAKGDASQHAAAALERLLEIERRWPHYSDRLKDQLDIPESVDALREELRRCAQDRTNGEDGRDVALARSDEHTERGEVSFEDDLEHSNTDGFDTGFSRGADGRSR